VRDAGAGSPSRVTNNWPIAPGDVVRSEKASRTELDFGDVLLQLEASSELEIDALETATTEVQLTTGIARLDIRDSVKETIRLQLANARIQISAPGAYRIEVAQNGDAWMTVRQGQAKIITDLAVFDQRSDEEVAIAREGTFSLARAPPKENPDSREARSRDIEGMRSVEHVRPSLAGSRDLNDYGVWRWIPEFGMAWEPTRVARDWAPYRFGQWIWKSPWGWTWVDDAPWGFAPFHFGRWAYIGAHWMWVPGPRQVPAAYAPALVRWVRPSREHDSVGWYPLAPGEEYIPPYAASDSYKRSVNLFAVVTSRTMSPHARSTDLISSTGLTWTSREMFAHHPSPDASVRASVR